MPGDLSGYILQDIDSMKTTRIAFQLVSVLLMNRIIRTLLSTDTNWVESGKRHAEFLQSFETIKTIVLYPFFILYPFFM